MGVLEVHPPESLVRVLVGFPGLLHSPYLPRSLFTHVTPLPRTPCLRVRDFPFLPLNGLPVDTIDKTLYRTSSIPCITVHLLLSLPTDLLTGYEPWLARYLRTNLEERSSVLIRWSLWKALCHQRIQQNQPRKTALPH